MKKNKNKMEFKKVIAKTISLLAFFMLLANTTGLIILRNLISYEKPVTKFSIIPKSSYFTIMKYNSFIVIIYIVSGILLVSSGIYLLIYYRNERKNPNFSHDKNQHLPDKNSKKIYKKAFHYGYKSPINARLLLDTLKHHPFWNNLSKQVQCQEAVPVLYLHTASLCRMGFFDIKTLESCDIDMISEFINKNPSMNELDDFLVKLMDSAHIHS